MFILQRIAKFYNQMKEPDFRYTHRITGGGPEVLETKFEEQRYTSTLNWIIGEGPVSILLSEQGNGIPVSPTGLLVDCQPTFQSSNVMFPTHIVGIPLKR